MPLKRKRQGRGSVKLGDERIDMIVNRPFEETIDMIANRPVEEVQESTMPLKGSVPHEHR